MTETGNTSDIGIDSFEHIFVSSVTTARRYCEAYILNQTYPSDVLRIYDMTENNVSVLDTTSFENIYVRSIASAETHCRSYVLNQPYPNDGQIYCNATFDGYSCWNYTKVGTRVYGKCPRFFVHRFGNTDGLPFKDCNIDGSWYRHPESNKTWSDYTPCTDTVPFRRAQTILNIYFGGYAISMVSLGVALGIFCYYRELKCPRITLHKHMLLSYILAALLWILYYASTSTQPSILLENPIWCRVFHVLAQFATCSNYAWMFCEGLYLHSILAYTFVNKMHLLTMCYIVGWAIPIIQTLVYFIIRLKTKVNDAVCWHGQVKLHWILLGPIVLELLMNTFFLVNVLRILCRKGLAVNQSDRSHVRRSMRATLMLIPLLGIQYLAIPYKPVGHETLVHIYNLLSAVLVSLQGFVVSFLFCFLNEEVIYLIRTQLDSSLRRNLSGSDTIRSSVYSHTSNKRFLRRPAALPSNVFKKLKQEMDEKHKKNTQVHQTSDCMASSFV